MEVSEFTELTVTLFPNCVGRGEQTQAGELGLKVHLVFCKWKWEQPFPLSHIIGASRCAHCHYAQGLMSAVHMK